MKKNLLNSLCFCLAFAISGGDCCEMKANTNSPDSEKTTRSASCSSAFSSPNFKKEGCNDCLSDTDEDENFSRDDAFFAINGAKMDLKEALICKDNSALIKSAISTLISIHDLGYQNVLGYQYCLGMLCINFENSLVDDIQSSLFGEVNNLQKLGKQFLEKAQEEGDIDAENYLQLWESK